MENNNPYGIPQNAFNWIVQQEINMKHKILVKILQLPESQRDLMLQLNQEGATIGELMSGMRLAPLLQKGATTADLMKARSVVHIAPVREKTAEWLN